jgi:hypothetical protein
MTEHVHEWQTYVAPNGDYHADCFHCSERLDVHEINRRLNATERLSAEMAREAVHARPLHALALLAYADIREGKR